MKKITSTVKYTVPHWNFCNIDRFDMSARVPTELCDFCVKTRTGYKCTLHNETLSMQDGLVNKTRACCKATAGFNTTVDATQTGPEIDPKDLMKQTIELYSKTVNDLLNQGYPRTIAEATAKTHILGGRKI